MSGIDRLVAAQDALIQALDGGDVAAIEHATAAVADIVAALRAEPVTDRSRPDIEHALRQGHAARSRVNFLADRTRQKLDRLARRGASSGGSTYSSTGRLTAFGC